MLHKYEGKHKLPIIFVNNWCILLNDCRSGRIDYFIYNSACFSFYYYFSFFGLYKFCHLSFFSIYLNSFHLAGWFVVQIYQISWESLFFFSCKNLHCDFADVERDINKCCVKVLLPYVLFPMVFFFCVCSITLSLVGVWGKKRGPR